MITNAEIKSVKVEFSGGFAVCEICGVNGEDMAIEIIKLRNSCDEKDTAYSELENSSTSVIGELEYDRDTIEASRDAWQKLAELLSEKCIVDNMVTSYVHCIHCGDYAKSEDGIIHSPDCPIEQLRKMKES